VRLGLLACQWESSSQYWPAFGGWVGGWVGIDALEFDEAPGNGRPERSEGAGRAGEPGIGLPLQGAERGLAEVAVGDEVAGGGIDGGGGGLIEDGGACGDGRRWRGGKWGRGVRVGAEGEVLLVGEAVAAGGEGGGIDAEVA